MYKTLWQDSTWSRFQLLLLQKKKKITPKFHGLKEQQSFYNVIDMWVRNLERVWLSPSNLGSL